MEELNVEKYSESNCILSFYEEYTSTYRCKYIAEVYNAYLQKEKILKAYELYDLEHKVETQFIDWSRKEGELRKKESIELSVEQRNQSYQKDLQDIDNILLYTLSINNAIDWNSLKEVNTFTKSKPLPRAFDKLSDWELKNKPTLLALPQEPQPIDYMPHLSLIEKLYLPLKRKKEEECARRFKQDYEEWVESVAQIKEQNDTLLEIYHEKKQEKEKDYHDRDEKEIKDWENEKDKFYMSQQLHNTSVDAFKEKYIKYDKKAIEKYCELVLNNSKYPDFISKKFTLEFNQESRLLIVEYQLPDISHFPTKKECKYIKHKGEYKVTFISSLELDKIYEKALYDITLRSIHELYEADVINAIQLINFNGWVNCIDKATGISTNNCIISIQVEKNEFLKIHLINVDSKSCFKKLKGVSCSKLSAITPIRPIIQIAKK